MAPCVPFQRATFGCRWFLAPLPFIWRRLRAKRLAASTGSTGNTGNRLKQQNVDAETGDVVPREDTARGYEVARGQHLIVEDQEIDVVQIESTRTIEIDQFVPRSQIDDRFIDSPYYLAPDGKVGQDAFAVIRETIAKMGMVAIGRVVLTRREHVIALEPRG